MAAEYFFLFFLQEGSWLPSPAPPLESVGNRWKTKGNAQVLQKVSIFPRFQQDSLLSWGPVLETTGQGANCCVGEVKGLISEINRERSPDCPEWNFYEQIPMGQGHSVRQAGQPAPCHQQLDFGGGEFRPKVTPDHPSTQKWSPTIDF